MTVRALVFASCLGSMLSVNLGANDSKQQEGGAQGTSIFKKGDAWIDKGSLVLEKTIEETSINSAKLWFQILLSSEIFVESVISLSHAKVLQWAHIVCREVTAVSTAQDALVELGESIKRLNGEDREFSELLNKIKWSGGTFGSFISAMAKFLEGNGNALSVTEIGITESTDLAASFQEKLKSMTTDFVSIQVGNLASSEKRRLPWVVKVNSNVKYLLGGIGRSSNAIFRRGTKWYAIKNDRSVISISPSLPSVSEGDFAIYSKKETSPTVKGANP